MKQLYSILYLAVFTTIFFSAGASAAIQCNQCHGTSGPADFRPLDSPYRNISTGGFKGNHRKHMGATASAANCNTCHGNGVDVSTYLINHRNKKIDMVVNINNSPKLGGATYSKGVFFNQTSTPVTGSCSNVNCHFESTTPAWESAPFTTPNDCNKCHGVPPNGTNGADGSHAKHEIYYSGVTNCQKCHANHTTFAHATSAGKRNLNISFAAAPNNGSGTYSGALNDYLPSQSNTFGSCSATYCHGTSASPAWGSGTLACSACHAANNALPGAHNQHWEDATVATSYTMAVGNSGTAGIYRFSCSSCHNLALAAHAAGPGNINGAAQVFFGFTSATRKGTYTYGGSSAGSDNGFGWTAGTGCQNTYCHSNGNGSAPANTTFTWATASGTLLCTGCHGDAASGTLSGKHAQHVNNAAVLGTNNSFGCVECHAKTVSNSTTISNKLNHVNKLKDYSGAKANDNYNTGTKTCTSVYCHSNGNISSLVYVNPAAWNSATVYGCNGCHGTSNTTTGAPDYANGGAATATANSHNKHVTQLNITDTTGCAVCHKRTVDTATANKLRNYSTLHLNGSTNVSFNSTKAGVNANWNSGTCATVTCHSNGRGTYQSPQWGQTDNCGFCHLIASLGGAHAKHIDLTKMPVFYTVTANRSSGDDVTGKYNFGCSACHPLTNTLHTTGPILIDFRPAVAGVGTLRVKNSASITAGAVLAGTANSGTIGTSGSTVKCLNIYCHSNGYTTTTVYATTPDWYGGAFAGDRCANCHGNSPNSTIAGSPAHYNTNFIGTGTTSGHVVGIHYNDISNGATGEATAGTGTANSHGNSLYSSTMNCDTCHNATVTSAANDKNVICTTCHNGTQATLRGNAAIANKANHVSGSVNVAFNPIAFKSKAQVRQFSFSKYSGAFKRPAGYKTAGSYDQDKLVFNTATMWNSGSKTCSNISCHNGNAVVWTATGGATSCGSCHNSL